MSDRVSPRGPIAWMAKNRVAANLLMAILLIGGLVVGRQVKQEVFPEFDLDMVSITVPYPGASPEEVEKGILMVVEQAVRGLDGVKKVTATANEGGGSVMVELLMGTDGNKATSDIKNAVDRIRTFPLDAERPIVSLVTLKRDVITLILYGDLDERTLRNYVEQAKDELLLDERVSQVELGGVRRPEISVEVPVEKLRAHGVTLEQVARAIGAASIELPSGGVKATGGEVLLRVSERRDWGHEFADILVASYPDGTELRVGDLAEVVDGFEDTDEFAYWNGKPAAMVDVYRVGDETPIEVADAVKAYVKELRERLPEGVGVTTSFDRSQIYRERIDLLLRNAYLGLVLVLVLLGLVLEVRLAFWVTMGIPISFMGSLLLMPAMGVSINMISLFAFIITLGMVVDDAIVVGENIFEHRQRGLPFIEASILGARQMAMPVSFSILTTVAAFLPMFFVPGVMGKVFFVIPAIVVSVLAISLLEAFLILPAHLAHVGEAPKTGLWGGLFRVQGRFSRLFEWLIHNTYAPSLRLALRHRYVTVATAIAILVATIGFMRSGRLDFTFMPKVEGDRCVGTATLPFGSPIEETIKVQERMLAAARRVIARHGGDDVLKGTYTQVGRVSGGHGPAGGWATSGSHLCMVRVELVPMDQRDFSARTFSKEWREEVGEVPGLESLTFRFNIGPSGGDPIDVQLTHSDHDTLERAAVEVAEALGTYPGVIDIDDGYSAGKPQLELTLTQAARSLGVTETYLARQVRAAFYGAEALRQQRGVDEVRVMVRLPRGERRSLRTLETLLIRTPEGGEIPLAAAANIALSRSYTQIRRVDARRVLNVKADIEEGVANADKVLKSFQADLLPDILARNPGLGASFEGESEARRESIGGLAQGYMLALLLIFALLAVPFKSYVQPLIVMSAIPFGVVGAVAGHVLMGYDMSLISVMGIVALSGVVVNDSLVMVDAANQRRRDGEGALAAITWAGVRRFRPIVMTSLTTFGGLAPMIFETSLQARFLIPMAISLGYGILIATFIILLLVPSFYMVMEDVAGLFGLKTRSEHVDAEEQSG